MALVFVVSSSTRPVSLLLVHAEVCVVLVSEVCASIGRCDVYGAASLVFICVSGGLSQHETNCGR